MFPLDELFDVFERDRRRTPVGRRRGLRGFLSRLSGDDRDDHDARRHTRREDDDRWEDDRDDRRPCRRGRREAFDWDD